MPRTKLAPAYAVEHLAVLSEDGQVDEELEPQLDEATLRAFYRTMLLARRLDERMLSLHRQGRLGTFAPVRGQEAAQVGAVAVLEPTDWMVPSYRELAASLWRGSSPSGFLLYNAGYNEGGAIPAERLDLPTSVPVGTQMLHAAGLAYGLCVRKAEHNPVVLTFFGDGATSQGDFHEAMNFASVFDCPVIFLCQNNGYAISTPRSRQTRSRTLAQKAFAYEVPCLQVDGNDVLAVYAAALEAAERARAERRPTLVECVTYRLAMHTTVDDPTKYREQAEVERWQARDPIPRFQRYLEQRGLLDGAEIDTLEHDIEALLKDAVGKADQAIAGFDDPLVIFDHVFAQAPAYLREQRRELRRELAERESQPPARAGGNGREARQQADRHG